MQTDGLLTLMQWLSPAFPVGSFAYSHGLERAIAVGEVTTAGAMHSWIGAILSEGAGRTDAILLVQALRGESDLAVLSALAEAMPASRERWVETMEQGQALSLTVNALTGQDYQAMPYPVVLGAAARGLGVDAERVAGMYLQAFATNLVLVGVRFVPLGQTEGQRVLAGLQSLVLRVAAEAVPAGLDGIGSGAFRGDLAAMAHETMDVRIYRT